MRDREARRAYNRAYYQRNRDELIARQIARQSSPEAMDERRAKMRERYWEDPERFRLEGRQYLDANRDAISARRKARYAANPQPYIERARARVLHVSRFDSIDRSAVFERDGGLCGVCGLPILVGNWHLDHIFPLIHGGHHNWTNVQPAHAECNWWKRDRIMPRVTPPIQLLPY